MINIQEKKDKIISFLKENGPSLPVRIAKAIEMEPMFASAITSELIGSKQVKTSHLRIGSSPLYFLPGEEQKLEEYTENLKSAEKEAYLKLKKNKIIIDEDEDPVTRVALRNIKDFAISSGTPEKTTWKYAFISEEKIEEELPSKDDPIKEKETLEVPKLEIKEIVEDKTEPKEKIVEIITQRKEIVLTENEPKKIESIFNTTEEEKEEPEFLIEIKKFLEDKNLKFIEEIRTEKKEVMAIVSINSQLDNINFLLIAKNKKTITKNEVDASIQIATKNKMPCLLIIRKEPSRPIQKLIDENNLIKLEIMK
jgi:hypothetical protein